MSQPADVQSPSPSAVFDADLFQTSVLEVQQDFAIVGLLCALYVWALTRRKGSGHGRQRQPNSIILCLTIFALFASTTAYMVTCMLSCQSIFLKSFISSGYALWSKSSNADVTAFSDGPLKQTPGKDYTMIHSCASTAAITTNITLGDAIVCWRASVVWFQTRTVRATLLALLLATFVLGATDTAWGCRAPYRVAPLTIYSFVPLGTSPGHAGLPLGIAACALSLATNLLATLLVAYKAWESRRRLWGHFVVGGTRAQVQQLLALLVESGAVYCALWGVVVAFQVGEHGVGHPASTPVTDTTDGFLNVFNVFMSGGLVPLIHSQAHRDPAPHGQAIYPAFIIVLVALNRSPIDRGFSQQNADSVPTPHISAMVGMASVHVDVPSENSASASDAPVIDGRDKLRPRGIHNSQDTSARTSLEDLEQKAEEMV
ncbi:hypothetical protein GSI_08201 [Ganoderma sinense ZZ0214-1]|uniref:Uncharacterized protein n=1 Tax=Ganoderma sinense ZZ0214-1 TaxID=1077348 RepID=A0A2G8S747_9APHY|nr:hypothetical protein GSI_08201 [Ganoderma sinense ZZ0214-1]